MVRLPVHCCCAFYKPALYSPSHQYRGPVGGRVYRARLDGAALFLSPRCPPPLQRLPLLFVHRFLFCALQGRTPCDLSIAPIALSTWACSASVLWFLATTMVLPPTYPQQPPPCADEPVLVSPYASSLHLQNPGVFQRDALRPPAAPAPAPAHGTHATHATQPIQRPNTEDKQAYRQPVYIVRCAHCNTFFTDRGMRALLLLKPNVSLFSTDAIPTNCSAVYAPEAVLEQEVDPESPKQRTCTCLTQTLGCNGCGSVVGYHVVSPCHRCSTNVARHTRSSNGYVFHRFLRCLWS